ncbi:hypothetical protein RUND412_005840 [Rhizina undulata]
MPSTRIPPLRISTSAYAKASAAQSSPAMDPARHAALIFLQQLHREAHIIANRFEATSPETTAISPQTRLSPRPYRPAVPWSSTFGFWTDGSRHYFEIAEYYVSLERLILGLEEFLEDENAEFKTRTGGDGELELELESRKSKLDQYGLWAVLTLRDAKKARQKISDMELLYAPPATFRFNERFGRETEPYYPEEEEEYQGFIERDIISLLGFDHDRDASTHAALRGGDNAGIVVSGVNIRKPESRLKKIIRKQGLYVWGNKTRPRNSY